MVVMLYRLSSLSSGWLSSSHQCAAHSRRLLTAPLPAVVMEERAQAIHEAQLSATALARQTYLHTHTYTCMASFVPARSR